MVTVYDAGSIFVASTCAACGDHLSTADQCVCLVRWPGNRAELLCLECHLCVIASATAWLKGDRDDGMNAVRKRLGAALAAHERVHDDRAN